MATEQQTKAIKPVEQLKQSLQKMDGQFKAALPSHITAEKFTRVLMTAVSQTPALVEADRQSLFGACMKAAQDGLLPDGREGAIVTFNSNGGKIAQWMPMTAGLLKKMRNSGEIASITSQIVYSGDAFDYYIDDEGEHISHRPLMFGDRGERIGAYSLLKTKDGAIYIECMNAKQIADVKNVSRSKNNGPWNGPFEEEMWKKTTLRRLSKRAPMSTDVEEQIRRDDDLFMPEKEVKGKATPVAKTEALPAPAIEPEILPSEAEQKVEEKKAVSRLHNAVNKKKEAAPPAEPNPSMEDAPIDRPAIFAQEEENDLDRALSEDTV